MYIDVYNFFFLSILTAVLLLYLLVYTHKRSVYYACYIILPCADLNESCELHVRRGRRAVFRVINAEQMGLGARPSRP